MEPKFQNFSEGVNPENPRLRRSRKCLRHPKYCAPPCFLAHVNFAVSPCSWANIKRSALTAHWLVLSTLDLDFFIRIPRAFPHIFIGFPKRSPFLSVSRAFHSHFFGFPARFPHFYRIPLFYRISTFRTIYGSKRADQTDSGRPSNNTDGNILSSMLLNIHDCA